MIEVAAGRRRRDRRRPRRHPHLAGAPGIQDVLETDAAETRAHLPGAARRAPPARARLPERAARRPGRRARAGPPKAVRRRIHREQRLRLASRRREEAVALIERAHADAVAVGRAVIANPDLVERWRDDAPENAPRPDRFYTPGAGGVHGLPAAARLSRRPASAGQLSIAAAFVR